MNRDIIHLDANYDGISLVFEDDNLAETVRNALKKAKKITTVYVGNKAVKVASKMPKFSIDFYEVITEEQYTSMQTKAEQERQAEEFIAELNTQVPELRLVA
jgi:hypothetical protein